MHSLANGDSSNFQVKVTSLGIWSYGFGILMNQGRMKYSSKKNPRQQSVVMSDSLKPRANRDPLRFLHLKFHRVNFVQNDVANKEIIFNNLSPTQTQHQDGFLRLGSKPLFHHQRCN